MNDDLLSANINNAMRQLSPIIDPRIEWEKMYEEFRKIDEAPTIITESQFKKFAPLYQAVNMKSRSNYTVNEFVALKNLSDEFIKLVNPYKKFLVVQDHDHSEVIYELPAVFNRVNPLNEHEEDNVRAVEAVNVFDNFGHHQLAKYRHTGALYLHEMLMTAQNAEDYAKNMKEYGELTAKFHNDPTVAITEEKLKMLEEVGSIDDAIIYEDDEDE